MISCPACGAGNSADHKYCVKCGSALSSATGQLIAQKPLAERHDGGSRKRNLLHVVLPSLLVIAIAIGVSIYVATRSKISSRGNSTGNITNVGLAALQGDWIYYVNSNDGD